MKSALSFSIIVVFIAAGCGSSTTSPTTTETESKAIAEAPLTGPGLDLLEFLATENRGWVMDDGETRFKVSFDENQKQFLVNDRIVRSVSDDGRINAVTKDNTDDPLEVGECFTVKKEDDDNISVTYWDQCARPTDTVSFSRESFEEANGVGVAIFFNGQQEMITNGKSVDVSFYASCEEGELGKYNETCLDDFPSATQTFYYNGRMHEILLRENEPSLAAFAVGEMGLIHVPYYKKGVFGVLIRFDQDNLYWVDDDVCETFTWEEYLQRNLKGVTTNLAKNPLRSAPADDADTIQHRTGEPHEFIVTAVDNDWVKLEIDPGCGTSVSENYFGDAWIRWRQGNKLLISIHPCLDNI